MDIANLVFSFFNNAGPGGLVVVLVLVLAMVIYILLTRWIVSGGSEK